MDKIKGLGLAVGVFFGNWLVVPFLVGQAYGQGFFIGVMAACLVLLWCNR